MAAQKNKIKISIFGLRFAYTYVTEKGEKISPHSVQSAVLYGEKKKKKEEKKFRIKCMRRDDGICNRLFLL